MTLDVWNITRLITYDYSYGGGIIYYISITCIIAQYSSSFSDIVQDPTSCVCMFVQGILVWPRPIVMASAQRCRPMASGRSLFVTQANDLNGLNGTIGCVSLASRQVAHIIATCSNLICLSRQDGFVAFVSGGRRIKWQSLILSLWPRDEVNSGGEICDLV